MRRREKFVVAAVLLSLALLGVQYVPLEYRYWAVSVLALAAYGLSAWALSDDLQRHEWLTIVPMPALYSLAVGLFYFLLPASWMSRVIILGVFAVGMYALYLCSNIFSVAKGRTIQLLHAAHTITTFMTLVTSILFLNTIFSLKLPFWLNGGLVAITHWPILFVSLWSVRLEHNISRELLGATTLLTLLVVELAVVFSFIPFSVWHISLLLMSVLYVGLGLLQSHLRGRLFDRTLTEYSLVGGFILVVFLLLFPAK